MLYFSCPTWMFPPEKKLLSTAVFSLLVPPLTYNFISTQSVRYVKVDRVNRVHKWHMIWSEFVSQDVTRMKKYRQNFRQFSKNNNENIVSTRIYLLGISLFHVHSFVKINKNWFLHTRLFSSQPNSWQAGPKIYGSPKRRWCIYIYRLWSYISILFLFSPQLPVFFFLFVGCGISCSSCVEKNI